MSQSHEGSSPLTRGKPEADRARREQVRLIPAHAGKTPANAPRSTAQGAHPRSRGENWRWALICARSAGSSPLTRGKHTPRRADHRGGRLIPAHAGKTTANKAQHEAQRAHPRSRGENRRNAETRARLQWLIPAHAGKTVLARSAVAADGAHPRSRGENAGMRQPARPRSGSSPLTRGKRALTTSSGPSFRAHPRSRGENPVSAATNAFAAGSSPLTRGKPFTPNQRNNLSGLIPAHAGKTTFRLVFVDTLRAHPRSRGENKVTAGLSVGRVGSSPLTRGKPQLPEGAARSVRLIPAHAGKTRGVSTARHPLTAHPRSRGENPGVTMHALRHRGSSPLTRGKRLRA